MYFALFKPIADYFYANAPANSDVASCPLAQNAPLILMTGILLLIALTRGAKLLKLMRMR